MIKTSVIVPVYNTAEYLRDCFDSIYRQTQKEIEVIAINDGSTDNSLDILREIQKEHPDMILYSQENKGPGASRNKGMELASGEFVFFCDSDDCLLENAMDTCYFYAKENSLDMVTFDAETFGDIECEKENYDRSEKIKMQYTVLSGEVFAARYWKIAFNPTVWLIYTSFQFIKENNLKFPQNIYYEDNVFYCRSMSFVSRLMYVPQILYRRRYRNDSIMTSKFDLRHAQDFLAMVREISKQKYSGKMESVIYELKLRFLRGLYEREKAGDLLENHQFARVFFETAVYVCVSSAGGINDYYAIGTLCQIADAVPMEVASSEIKEKIRQRKKEIVRILFKNIPLHAEDQYIGLYGTGKKATRFLEEYENCVGDIQARVVPIESSAMTGKKKYRNWDIVNVNDIGALPLTCIVVTSSKYEQEMYLTLKQKYGNQFRIICLSSDLHF